MLGQRTPSLHGLFFLGFLGVGAIGAPLLTTGCSSEAQASPPTATQPSEPAEAEARAQDSATLRSKPPAQITQMSYWRQGDGGWVTAYNPQESLAPLVEAVEKAVVSIHTRNTRGMFAAEGMGSGFIVSADGLVITNHHVIDGNDKLEIHLADGRRFEGTVVGSDPQTDVAVVRLSGAKDLPTVVIGSSEALRVGDWVLAMGSPMGLEHTVTRGIISAEGRGSLGLYRDGYADFLQTDAAINPGNSGGPLFNLAGEVIGINTAIGGHNGLGFAVPIDQAKVVIPKLIEEGKVTRGWLGVSGRDEAPEYGVTPKAGAVIGEVHSNGPGAAGGLRVGDLVVEIEGKGIADFDALRTRVGEFGPNQKVGLVVVRDGKREKLEVVLAERPDPDALSRFDPNTSPNPNSGSAPAPAPTPAPTPSTPKSDLYDGAPARLGVEVRETGGGVTIERVVEGGIGHRLGLRESDVIETVNGKTIASIVEIAAALESDRGGAEIVVKRDGGRHVAVINGG